jgi:hypothetical protein
MKVPLCESFIEHENGSTAKVAGWLFECLDADVPEKEYVVFYLCYHSSDLQFFSSSSYKDDLTNELLKTYKRELQWDGLGFGDLKFDLNSFLNENRLVLKRRRSNPPRPGSGFKGKGPEDPDSVSTSEIDIYLTGSDEIARPGFLCLVRCAPKKLKPDDLILATLRVTGDAIFTRHLEVCQLESRWQQPIIFLSNQANEILVGKTPGCDIVSAAIPEPLKIKYDGENAKWSWRLGESAESGGGLERLDLIFPNTRGPALSLRGESVSDPQPLEKFEKENRLPFFSIKIIGCVFPKLQGGKDGYFPDGFPGKNKKKLISVIKLPGNKWMYLLKGRSNPYFLDPGQSMDGRLLKDGEGVFLERVPSTGEVRKGIWNSDKGLETREFHGGELRFSPEFTVRLSVGPNSGDFPNDYFANYSDVALGSSPVTLITRDGRSFSLKFKETVAQEIFLIDKELRPIERFEPNARIERKIGDAADFILGTTHYELTMVSQEDNPTTFKGV